MQVGKYQLIHKLATGGMAEVFLAKSAGPLGFEKLLVLKRILPHLATEPMFVEMFLTEARLAAQLNHPNIAQIFDFGESDGTYFLAMEYVDGPNLRELIKRASGVSLTLAIPLCARIISAACEGLAFAHSFWDPVSGQPMTIIHRDISPDNILLSRQGAVKVVDFGIAKAAGVSPHTQTGVLKGKLAYMPPEQLRNEPLDRRADVYSLGIVFYELLTGLKPFMTTSEAGTVQAILFEQHVPVEQRRPDVPDAVQRILGRALAKERERRYPDCASFQADLEEFILSTAKPMGASQIAQIVAMMTTGSENSLPRPHPALAPRSNPKLVLPPLPSTLEPAASSRPHGSRESKDERTSAARPSRLSPNGESRYPHTTVLRAASSPESSPSRLFRRADKDAVWAAVVGIVLLVLGGGYLIQRIPLVKEAEATPIPPQVLPVVTVDAGSPSLDGGVLSSSEPPAEAKDAGSEQSVSSVAAVADAGSTTRLAKVKVSPPPEPEELELEPELGLLELRVEPEALMFLNGWQMGKTRREPFEVEPGHYTLKLVNTRLGKEVKRQITVTAGQTTRVEVNLSQE